MTLEGLAAAKSRELALQLVDAEVRALLAARNSLEAFVLDTRGAPRRKHGDSIDARALSAVLDECEDWIFYNCAADSCTDTAALEKKTAEVKAACSVLMRKYVEATEVSE
jgi:hypothetical protein